MPSTPRRSQQRTLTFSRSLANTIKSKLLTSLCVLCNIVSLLTHSIVSSALQTNNFTITLPNPLWLTSATLTISADQDTFDVPNITLTYPILTITLTLSVDSPSKSSPTSSYLVHNKTPRFPLQSPTYAGPGAILLFVHLRYGVVSSSVPMNRCGESEYIVRVPAPWIYGSSPAPHLG